MIDIEELEASVHSIIASSCNVQPIDVERSDSMLSLGIDSLTMIAIVARLQARYGVELPSDDVVELLNLHQVADFVRMLHKSILQQQVSQREQIF